MATGKSLELAKLRMPSQFSRTLITEINFKKGHRAKSMPPSQRKMKRAEERANYRGAKKYAKYLASQDNYMVMEPKVKGEKVRRFRDPAK